MYINLSMLGDPKFPPEDSSVNKYIFFIYTIHMSTNAEGKMRNKGKNTEGEISTGSECLHCIDEHVTGGT